MAEQEATAKPQTEAPSNNTLLAQIESLASKVATLETNHQVNAGNIAQLLETVPVLGSKVASIEAVVSVLNNVPGVTEVEGEAGSWIADRVAALEGWAAKLPMAVHHQFAPAPAPSALVATDPNPADVAAKK